MSSTTNVQSYLPYVFRPVYTWTGSNFTTTFNLSNIDTLSVRAAKFGVIYAGDISNNVYIGSNTGNAPAVVANCNASSNTAIGISSAAALSGSSNSEFIGFQAGSVGKVICNTVVIGESAALSNSNVSNSILIGTSNSAGLSNIFTTISIGGNAGGTGSSNIFIGSSNGLGMLGSSNVLIGHGVNLASIPGYVLVDGTTPGPSFSNASNLFMVGSSNKILIAGNFSNGVVSIGSTNTNANVCNAGLNNSEISNTISNLSLDVSKFMRVQRGLAIGCDPDNGFTLDSVGSFRAQNGYGQIYLSNTGVNAEVNISAVGNGNMTLNVAGPMFVSNATVSNQVSAAVGYSSVRSGLSGVSIGPTSSVLIPLKNNGLVVASVYDSSTTPICYTCTYMVNSSVAPILLSQASNVSPAGVYTVTMTTTNLVISNALVTSAIFRYNVTFYPIG